MRYAVVIEKAQNNYSAYVPDLPGCVATGATIDEVEAQIREAIEFHLDGLREDGSTNPTAFESSRVHRSSGIILRSSQLPKSARAFFKLCVLVVIFTHRF